MLVWVSVAVLSAVIGGFALRIYLKRRKRAIIAARRVIEKPNSFYASKSVQDQEDAEWWSEIRVDRLHEVNREYVERLLVRVRGAGVESLNREERAFLERMASLEAPPRRSVRPEQNPWPFPA